MKLKKKEQELMLDELEDGVVYSFQVWATTEDLRVEILLDEFTTPEEAIKYAQEVYEKAGEGVLDVEKLPANTEIKISVEAVVELCEDGDVCEATLYEGVLIK